MWCFISFLALGLIVGIVFACIEADGAIIGPCLIVGGIAGILIAVVLSIGVWMFAPESAYITYETADFTVKENAEGELLYFNVTHDESNTYLYYMNQDQKVQKVRLSDATVQFINDGEPAHIEVYRWKFKNGFLNATAFVPLTRIHDITTIYISESDWLKHTDGGVEHVITHAAVPNG